MTTTLGQLGFFKPHGSRVRGSALPVPRTTATSYYHASPLCAKHCSNWSTSISSIRERVHFAVSAVNVLSSNFLYFDNKNEVIGPEHVMASGALPPALPMVKIGTDHFWDSGIVSNTRCSICWTRTTS